MQPCRGLHNEMEQHGIFAKAVPRHISTSVKGAIPGIVVSAGDSRVLEMQLFQELSGNIGVRRMRNLWRATPSFASTGTVRFIVIVRAGPGSSGCE
jgi:hypothetical protein